MTRAFVLMTALPPTKGHFALIEYASLLADGVTVIVNTQPDEPLSAERVDAIHNAVRTLPNVRIEHIHQTLPQEPEDDPGFWDMWGGFLASRGFQPGDYIVASEKYGIRLAQQVDGVFMPYDLDRVISNSKATWARDDTIGKFDIILPAFQDMLRKRVTIFGAESVGKTTVAHDLAYAHHQTWVPEWARPYLEAVGPDITLDKMTNIWHGQRALQDVAVQQAPDHAFVIQDTDLYSTVGYWELKHKEFGSEGVPLALVHDAWERKSDLYIILKSNIPFEEDQLRYGGDKRESDDRFWIELCKTHNLPYVYVTASDLSTRIELAWAEMETLFGAPLHYHRHGTEYGVDKAADAG